MRLRLLLVIAVAVLALAAPGFAQQNGVIDGKVTDASGAIVPGVTITLTGDVLLQPLTAISSATGTYRFPGLAVGVYGLKFELAGFKTVVRTGLRLELNANVTIHAAMEVSTVQETVTVTGETPVVDLRDTSKTARLTQETLQSIPSARDPWVMIEQTPSVMMDRSNVGGSMSGQQSNFVARGAAMSQQKWNLDGVDITDMSATGGSPVYYDFDAFEEMQISTGGADVTMMTPGVGINLVTKSGTDRLRGSGRYYWTGEKFESVNVNDALRKQGASSGAPILDIKDYGFEVGGPIKRGRAWFWGAYGRQNVSVGVNGFYKPTSACTAVKAKPLAYGIKDVWDCLNSDLTELKNYNGKVAVAPFKNNQFSFFVNVAGKIRNARGADDLHPIESTNRQMGVTDPKFGSSWWKGGMPKTYKWGDRHVFTDKFMVEAQYAHVGNNFVMDFHTDDLAKVQASYERFAPAALYGRSYSQNIYVRPTDSIDLTGNYFAPGFLGGDHAIKFGGKIRNDIAHSETAWGGGALDYFAYGNPSYVRIYRNSYSEYQLRNRNIFLQDSYTRKRVTVNVGLRYDYQTDESRPGTVPTTPFWNQPTFNGTMTYCSSWSGGACTATKVYTTTGQPFNQLPSVTFNGAKAFGDKTGGYKNFSPRIGLTYDLTGNAKTVAKFSYARYVSQAGTGDLSSTYTTTGSTSYVQYPWIDLNGDKFVQANEIVMIATPLAWGGNYDYTNPGALAKPTGRNDPNIKMEHTDELIGSLDKAIGQDFAVGVSYIWRKSADFRQSLNTDATFTHGDWSTKNYTGPYTYTPAANACSVAGSTCAPVQYWTPNEAFSYFIYTNNPKYYRKYQGFELTARKRMSHRWMANASYAYNNTPQYYPLGSYQDPTNVQPQNGGQYAPQSTTSGLDNVFVNAKWMARVSGAYQLPWWQLGVAGFLNVRSGFPLLKYVTTGSYNYTGTTTIASSGASVYLDQVGSVRLPTVTQLDLRLDKAVTVSRVKAMLSVDLFNALNANSILAERRQQNSTNANQVSAILAPRVLRIGARITF